MQIPSGLERQLDRDGLLFDPRSDPIHVSANMCNHWPTGESKLPLSHISQRLKLQAMFPKILPALEPQVLHDWRAFALPILVLTAPLSLCGDSRYLKRVCICHEVKKANFLIDFTVDYGGTTDNNGKCSRKYPSRSDDGCF